MKRVLAILLFATSALAADKWWDAYNRGVAAVNGRNYALAASELQKAIAENPTEGTAVRAGNAIITYVPHFWLGIAKFNLGETDAALREWRISEEQGAIARTSYYAKLKDWMARAQTEKQRDAQADASGPKKSAEAALSRAVEMQMSAVSAGGDRTNPYRDAQRKVQDALTQFRKAGTDIAAYKEAEVTAQQAVALFAAAAEEGKKLKAAAASRPKPQQPVKPVIQEVKPAPKPVPPPPTPAPVISQAKVAAEVAVQAYRRTVSDAVRNARTPQLQKALREETRIAENLRAQLDAAKDDAEYDRVRLEVERRGAAMEKKIAELSAPPPPPIPQPATPQPATAKLATAKLDLGPAYRAFAAGDLTESERLLTNLLASTRAAEAYLLRGCVRYTRALLSRTPDAQLAAATSDFQAALQRDRALRLDPRVFSPKLVARFEQVRNGR